MKEPEDPRVAAARIIFDECQVAQVGAADRRDVLYALHRMEQAVTVLLEFVDEHVDLTPER